MSPTASATISEETRQHKAAGLSLSSAPRSHSTGMDKKVFMEIYRYMDSREPKPAFGGSEGESAPEEKISAVTERRTAGITIMLTVPIPFTPFSETKQAKTRNARERKGFACGRREFSPDSMPAHETKEPNKITALTNLESLPNTPFRAPSKPP